ncbi:PREDICTED: ribosome biogenesis [Prunus dulcis]|uniref:PREDICTED: ribosome biogenesis n=1 Tax=Prunus dulcis TaxID=3755 RepID=A0A5E4G580_PRUDU|nr:PREDICTED: ribosome biogenesis [Prunus dulcis]
MSDSEEYDLDDYPAIRDPDSEDEESGSSGNEGVLNSSNKDHLANDHGNDEESDSSELHEGVEESDSSEDEDVELTKEDIKSISRLLEGKAHHGDFDPYAPYVDWFKWDGSKHPLSNAPDPKRRLIPSKSESKLVNKIKLAIRKGLIKPKKSKEVEEEEESVYPLWGDDSNSTEKNDHLSYIPAPKPKLPGHEESFNPSIEYIPTQEEINSYQLTYEEDRPKFIPKRFTSMRSIPAYENAVKECFERCLDLFVPPSPKKTLYPFMFQLNIDPESLKPKLPNRNDLKPYPVSCYLEYRGHEDAVTSVSVEASGQWIASGLLDRTVRIWEVETGRCLKHYKIGEAIKYVAWNPNPEHSILAVSVGQDVLLLNTGCGNEEVQKRTKELLSVEMPVMTLVIISLDFLDLALRESRAIFIRKLSKKFTQTLSFKLRGIAVTSIFHPTLSFFFISTKKIIRVYDLVKEGKLVRKLEIRLREVSFIAVHPSGDHIIVGSREGKLCWFDMDLSSKPYKTLKLHQKDINNVCFHCSCPLFATCSDDCTAYVFHGMVYSDLNKNPLIVPLEILRGHSSTNERGVMDCKFHPRQPWLFTAGAGWLDVIAIERKRKETACTGSYCKLWISLVGSEFSVL